MADSCKPPVKHTLQVILNDNDMWTVLGAVRVSRNHFPNNIFDCAMWNTGIIVPDSVPCLLTMLSLHKIPRSFGVAYRSQYFTRLEKKKKKD